MKKLLFLSLIISNFCFSQIKGKVTDEKGNVLPFVSVYIDKSYNNTSTNEQGFYELNIKKTELLKCDKIEKDTSITL